MNRDRIWSLPPCLVVFCDFRDYSFKEAEVAFSFCSNGSDWGSKKTALSWNA